MINNSFYYTGMFKGLRHNDHAVLQICCGSEKT